ncbi:DNA cytosine methyltransferase [Halolamina sp. CBA1230]|uniref:DNA cytosine methyltransferase n=1 Tax=Halolamina sp. CBA1230 TaxID=1853690 RepID=UPI0009A18286|nr:DNA cytosine methyltransferase [Halolamina sp. CBA1230]QKY20658.1 DNA cytosine methyltransferase [Halolamina sp. CBA1230]
MRRDSKYGLFSIIYLLVRRFIVVKTLYRGKYDTPNRSVFVPSTMEQKYTIVDLYCGAGGVGLALDDISTEYEIDIEHIGIDIEDHHDTYPGNFVQGDCSDPEWLDAMLPNDIDLLWLSPPCTAYSTLSYANKHELGFDDPRDHYPTIDDLNVHEVIDRLDPDEYIIENVATCEDLREPAKLNGLAFDEPYDLERHFETSFDAPNNVVTGEPSVPLTTVSDDSQSQSAKPIARAKGVPEDWGSQVIRSAIPRSYVQYLLHYCPVVDVPLPTAAAPKQTLWSDYTARGHPLRDILTIARRAVRGVGI